MKKLKKGIAVFLSALMLVSVAVPCKVMADNDANVAVAASPVAFLETAKKATDITQKAIKAIGIDKMGSFGKGFASFVASFDKGLGLTNTVLKFFGISGSSSESGPTAFELMMYEELQAVHTQINQISAKVDKITDDLNQFQAEEEFRDISEKADLLYNNWYSYDQTYCEKGMDAVISEYKWVLRDGIERWCKNSSEDERTAYDIDNSKIIILFDSDNNLVFSRENGIPSEQKDLPYVILESDCLPQEMPNWTIDNYRELLETAISENIRKALDTDTADGIISVSNYPVLTKEGWDKATEEEKNEAIETICNGAVETLLYRISTAQINLNSDLTRRAIDSFNAYCTNLTGKRNNGLDAFLQAMYLSYGFEGELRDNYENFCNGMIVKTSEYASFALDLIGKSDKATKKESDSGSDLVITTNNWANTVSVLESAIENGLTGNDDYCYITGSRLQLIPSDVVLNLEIKVNSDWDYKAYKLGKTGLYSHDASYKENIKENMISSKDAQILNLLYLSKFGNDSYPDTFLDYVDDYCTKIGASKWNWSNTRDLYLADIDETVVDLTKSEDLKMGWTYDAVEGCYMNNKDLSFAKVRKKIVGTVIDTSKAQIYNNTTLSAIVFEEGKYCLGYYCGPHNDIGGNVEAYGASFMDNEYKVHGESNNTSLYTLVNVKAPTLTANLKLSNPEADNSYSPLDSLNNTLLEENGSASAIGGGSIINIIVLSAIAILALVIIITKEKRAHH